MRRLLPSSRQCLSVATGLSGSAAKLTASCRLSLRIPRASLWLAEISHSRSCRTACRWHWGGNDRSFSLLESRASAKLHWRTSLCVGAAARVPGLRIARGQCLESYGPKEAYYPMLEALGHLLRGPSAPSVIHTLAAQLLTEATTLMQNAVPLTLAASSARCSYASSSPGDITSSAPPLPCNFRTDASCRAMNSCMACIGSCFIIAKLGVGARGSTSASVSAWRRSLQTGPAKLRSSLLTTLKRAPIGHAR